MIAILDIDGTLVDTNYHHAMAWYRAFRDHGITVPIWQLHRHIGLGGDELVPAVTDPAVAAQLGDEIRSAQSDHFLTMIDEVQPMEGATALLDELARRGHQIVMASFAGEREADHYLDLLRGREFAEAWTTRADVEDSGTVPDFVRVALSKVDGWAGEAVLVADTPSDVEAATRAGVPTLAVLTGGFCAQELNDAGAVSVFESVADLADRIHWTSLR